MDPTEKVLPLQSTDQSSVAAYLRKIVSLIIGISFAAFGCSLTIKAAVGIGAWDALALTSSHITGIKVGTLAILFNSSCILGQLLIEKRNFKPLQFLQFINVLLSGSLINFFVYTVFSGLVVTNYPMRIILIVVAYLIIAFGVTVIMETNVIRNPLEGVCQLIADRIKKPMGRVRQVVDIGLILLTILLCWISRTEFTIREGTIICMLVFGPMLDVYKKPVCRILDRLHV